MEEFHLYKDIKARTGGEIFLGVVGPVRTGKSTFVRHFMELLVLPNLKDNEKKIATDELPTSGKGKTITTVEPKFVPKEAALLRLPDQTELKVRLVDCVGFPVTGADGITEKEKPRMVKTPWAEEEMPFEKAASMGTEKVIRDHATAGILITSDGSFGELGRESFPEAEKRTAEELQKTGKPCIALINSADPYGKAAVDTVELFEKEYGMAAMAVNLERLSVEDVQRILKKILYEFPLVRVEFYIPKWTETLEPEHPVKKALLEKAGEILSKVTHIRDLKEESLFKTEAPCVSGIRMEGVILARGAVKIRMEVDDTYYYAMLSGLAGVELKGEYQLISMIRELAEKKKAYEKVEAAIQSVEGTGYGVILPEQSEITLDEPTVIHQGSKYGVKIRAMSPSIHLIRADIETEIAPIVGSEAQAEDLIAYIRENSKSEEGIWNTNIFGKSVEQLVEDGIRTRLAVIGEESQKKLQDTMRRIVNESKGRLICIII